MNLKTWLKQAKEQIDSLDAELIAVKSFGPRKADRSWLVAHGDDKLIDRQWEYANRLMQKRFYGVPLAYVLGEKEFYGRMFVIEPGVLIPRPETENLIELVKSLDLPRRPRFLEIGTGSGCIAETLALEFSQSYVLATDVSMQALAVAERNDWIWEGRVELVESNLLKDLDFDEHMEHFDVVVANLPYVNKEWDWLDIEALHFEPEMAIYAKGNNGLSIYQRFLKELHHYNYDGETGIWLDYLVLEADPCQHASLIKMVKRAGFEYLKTDGYGLLFESRWRYWWDYKKEEFVRKPEKVLQVERAIGKVSFAEEEYMGGGSLEEEN